MERRLGALDWRSRPSGQKGKAGGHRHKRTEAASALSRGSIGGMQQKMLSPVPETRCGDGGGHQPVRIRRRNHAAPYRESEGSIVLLEGMGQQNPARGKGPCFVRATEARRVMEIAEWLSTSREGLAPFYSAPHPAPLPRGERKKGRGYIYYRSA